MRGLLCLVALVALFAYASASHYRYGTIYWQTTGVNTVNFTVETAWRRSYYTPLPNVGSTITLQSFYYGDGQKYDFPATVVTVNLKEDWVITIASFTHVYASAVGSSGLPWTAYFGGTARISTLQNNRDQPWYLTTTVNCNLASSPRSKMLPIANVLLVDSTTATFTVPAVTDDNTQVHYTMGNTAQICGKPGCVNPPNMVVDQVSGVVSWDVTTITPGLWTAVIMISTDKVMVPVDFIINYSKVPGKCATNCTKPGIQCILPTDCGQCASGGSCVKPQPPMFIAPTPSNTATYNVAANTPISFNVTAMSPQSGSTVTIQEGTLPVGAGLGPNVGSNPVVRTFTWLPYVNNLGPSIVCFSATDSIALTSAQYCITIEVSNGCIPACGGNSNCVNGKCECATGFFGPNCTSFGGEVYDGQTLYGSVAMHESNYYYFNPVSPTSAIKIVLETLEANFGTSIYISTTVQQPTITSNTWDEINENPNSIVITPDDPDYIFNATYYVAVEGWYASFDNLVDYNLTIFLS